MRRTDGLAMPPEFAPHERTLMAWPSRTALWGDHLEAAKREQAGVANAVAAFEPVTMVVGDRFDLGEARAMLSEAVELVELPVDDSWMRDNGPVFLTAPGRRHAVHFAFNAWGQKFHPYDADARVGRLLAERIEVPVEVGGLVLEGGSIHVDAEGTLVTTRQCLLHPTRNPHLTQEQIEARLIEVLGVRRVVWLQDGLVEDRDTDGHVDLIAVPLPDGRLALQEQPEGTPNHEAMARNRHLAEAAGLDVVGFEPLAYGTVDGQSVVHSYLNLYICNGGVVVPQAGDEQDAEALELLRGLFPDHEVLGTPGLTLAYGGGGPHCITQQVPAIPAAP